MLVFVDCEAYGGSPVTGRLTEFGAVTYPELRTFHARLMDSTPDPENLAVPLPVPMDPEEYLERERKAFEDFEVWLQAACHGEQPVFVSDNVAFDWQWVNAGFWRAIGRNPFGHSGRRISDFYAGLTGRWGNTQSWKRLRVTPHDHDPVNDALGNAEAFGRIMEGER